MGALINNNEDRIRLSSSHKTENTISFKESELTKVLLIENYIQEDYKFLSTVPVDEISTLCEFLRELDKDEEHKIENNGMQAYWKSDGKQRRLCPICGDSSLPGWVITFSYQPAFYIHDGECLNEMIETEADLYEIDDTIVHELI